MPDLLARNSFPAPPACTPCPGDRSKTDDTLSVRTLFWMILGPLSFLLAATIVCGLTKLDLYVTRLFFGIDGKFPYRKTDLADFVYDYGPLPGIVLGGVALVLFLGTFLFSAIRPWRKGSLLIALAILIGPGLLVNTVLKPNWGRPRPADIIQFGGNQPFVPPAVFGPSETARSFPSGHASMGFVFMLPAFLLLRKHRRAALAFFAFGITAGSLVGLSRIAEGRHFLSDIVWAGAIVYFTGLALFVVLNLWRDSQPRPKQVPPESDAEVISLPASARPATSENPRSQSAA